jgi:MFS family permease
MKKLLLSEHENPSLSTIGFLGYLTFGLVADRLGRRPAFSIYSVTMATGLIMITLMWDAVVV